MLFLHSLLSATILVASFHEPPKKVSHNAICLFSVNANDPTLVQEETMLDADIPGLASRDLLVSVITPASDKAFYDKMAKGSAFTVVLIDAEGRTRLKSDKPVRREAIYAAIDNDSRTTVPVHHLDKGTRQ